MNELTIWCTNHQSYLYYKTNQTTSMKALREFEWLCERIGIDISNLNVCEIELKNKNLEVFDNVTF